MIMAKAAHLALSELNSLRKCRHACTELLLCRSEESPLSEGSQHVLLEVLTGDRWRKGWLIRTVTFLYFL